MSLEVICDYKESLPVAVSTENPLIEELKILKRINIANTEKIRAMGDELKNIKKTIDEILKTVLSLNKEILNLIEE